MTFHFRSVLRRLPALIKTKLDTLTIELIHHHQIIADLADLVSIAPSSSTRFIAMHGRRRAICVKGVDAHPAL